MKPDELLAAAETVASKPSIANKYDNAADNLARHIQRMYDPTPTDRKWWLSVAGGGVVYFQGGYGSVRCPGGMVEFIYNGALLCYANTRGEVRRLCEVMGIELREDV